MWRKHLYDDAAYLARYAHQPLTEIGRMTSGRRRALVAAISRIVKAEETKP